MSSDFNWNTDEETDWDVDDDFVVQEKIRWQPPKWVLGGLIGVALLILVGFLIVRAVNQQVDEVADDVALNVLDSVNLTQQAVAADDIELFTGILSGREPNWSEAQKELVRADLWLSRPQLGLVLLAAAGSQDDLAPTEADVTLNPSLRSAEVELTHLYEADIGNGLSEIVSLKQTVVYREGETSWLFAPPSDEFWGEQTDVSVPYFDASGPARDTELIRRIVTDLSHTFLQLCSSGWLRVETATCNDPDLAIELDFITDPRFLLELDRLRYGSGTAGGGSGGYRLPAPSLIGQPTDGASYQALQRGYASLLFGWMLQASAGYVCCEHQLMFELILQLQLNQIGVQAWPLGEPQYRQLLRQMPTMDGAALYEETTPAQKMADIDWLYGLILYQVFHRGADPLELQRRLDEAESLAAWVAPAGSQNPVPFTTAFYADWRRFIYGQTSLSRQVVPVQQSSETLLLNCIDARRATPNATVLTSWQPGAVRPIDLSFFNSALFILPLPSDRGIVLHENVSPLTDLGTEIAMPSASRTLFWRDGSERLLNSAPIGAPRLTFTGMADPAGQRLLVQADRVGLGLITLDACGNGCAATALSGDLVRWSPDGSQALQATLDTSFATETPLIWLSAGDLEARHPLPDGYQPFWLDDDRYGYFVGQELRLSTISDPAATNSIALEIERPESPIDNSPLPLEVIHLVQNPRDSQQLLILLAEISRGRHFLMTLDLRSEKSTVIFDSTFAPADFIRPESMAFSPDGRNLKYVLASGTGPDMLYLHEVDSPATMVFDLPEAAVFGHDWSASGEWLTIARGSQLQLIRLTSDEQWFLDLGIHLNCQQLAWQQSVAE